MSRAHTCHATACDKPVPPEMFMCRPHWFSLPRFMRGAIWEHYREGQCDDMKPSVGYCKAAKVCVEYLAERDGVEADTGLYNAYLADAGEAQ